MARVIDVMVLVVIPKANAALKSIVSKVTWIRTYCFAYPFPPMIIDVLYVFYPTVNWHASKKLLVEGRVMSPRARPASHICETGWHAGNVNNHNGNVGFSHISLYENGWVATLISEAELQSWEFRPFEASFDADNRCHVSQLTIGWYR